MNEMESLRREIEELRARLARLEQRRERIELEQFREYARERDEALRRLPITPQEQMWRLFPPGTILCSTS